MFTIEYPPFNDLQRIAESGGAISGFLGAAETCCVMGTGFNPEIPPWREQRRMACADVLHFPCREKTYHTQQFILASSSEGKEFLIMSGRYHFYEGFSLQEVGYPIRVLAHAGIKRLILTSACGGVNPQFQVGDYVIVDNHVNLVGLNPLMGMNLDSIGPRFPNLLDGYSPDLRRQMELCSRKAHLEMKRGILGFLPGPCFETRAELEVLRRIGIDLVGWSSVPEAIVAMHAGMSVVSVAVVSDLSDPLRARVVTEKEVYEGAVVNRDRFAAVLDSFVSAEPEGLP